MGKGTIISGGAGGLYQVQINYNRTRYDAQIARFSTLRAALVIASAAELDTHKKALIELQILSIDKATIFLVAAMPDDVTVPAWCVDLTEDLTGVVGTFEVPGELIRLQIRPGYGGDAPYDATRDGQIMPTVSQDYAQAYYNLAMLPGWQKWKPLTRYATISAVSGDTASVTLDGATSSQQDLVINQSATLSGVAIDYMDCHGKAFEVGDEVLVIFTGQDWNTPKIVGFKDNPKPCGKSVYIQFAMATGAGPKTECCIVWDIDNDQYKTGVPDNEGTPVTFPVEVSEISDWFGGQSISGVEAVSEVLEEPGVEPHTTGMSITSNVTEVTAPAECDLPLECYIETQTGSDSIPYSGINYLGEEDQEVFRTFDWQNRQHDGNIVNETKTWDAPIRGFRAEGHLITSKTGEGGIRARTAALEYTREWYLNTCGALGKNTPSWPCDNDGYRDELVRTYDFEFKSPFSNLDIQSFSLVETNQYATRDDPPYCDVYSDDDSFQEQLYEIGSIKTDEAMVIFYFEEIVIKNIVTPCAYFTHLLLDCVGTCYNPPETITYEKKLNFNIKGFTHIVGDGETVGEVNPFEIAESTGLGAALQALKDLAESFSGEPGEYETVKIDYGIGIIG